MLPDLMGSELWKFWTNNLGNFYRNFFLKLFPHGEKRKMPLKTGPEGDGPLLGGPHW